LLGKPRLAIASALERAAHHCRLQLQRNYRVISMARPALTPRGVARLLAGKPMGRLEGPDRMLGARSRPGACRAARGSELSARRQATCHGRATVNVIEITAFAKGRRFHGCSALRSRRRGARCGASTPSVSTQRPRRGGRFFRLTQRRQRPDFLRGGLRRSLLIGRFLVGLRRMNKRRRISYGGLYDRLRAPRRGGLRG
jgi:hypothetical protein